MTKTVAPDPSALYVALDSFIAKDAIGRDTTVKEGTRLRGDNTIVIAHPELFASDGLDDVTLDDLKNQRRNAAIQRAIGGTTK